MGCLFKLWVKCVLIVYGLIALHASASSFESQQKNTAIFDGIKGEQGNLIIDPYQAIHIWKPQEQAAKSPLGFAYRKMNGDFIFTVQLKHSSATEHKILTGLQVENSEGDISLKTKLDTQENLFIEISGDKKQLPRLTQVKDPDILQIEQNGDELRFSAANFGKPLKLISRYALSKAQPLDVGVYRNFINNDKSVLEICNLRWVIPAWKNFLPYVDYLGSRLEILDVVSGERKVIYETAAGIEAPNWTSDGENIIYNSSGRVYKLHLPSKKISLVNTGFEVKNNNDHIVSFKGKFLGITHLDKGLKDNWTIYKLPINGGEPLQLTFKSPSFLHGWSPDGRYILYTSERNGQFEIYRGTSDGSGEELQLTNNNNMDDGSEYTPDGQFIYFNSDRSGGMRLWRMDADGKNPKQISHDHFNDWFPHISPDGKQILFLSYQPEIRPDLHPYYQQVYLRTLPVAGSDAKVVAYLYGGQGTLNVPSWSPDGRYAAFVSNSQLGSEKH